MNLFYDIELKSGEVIKDCYFTQYEIAVRTGLEVILAYIPSHDKCFDKYHNQVTGKDFSEFHIISIHDEWGNDYTEMLLSKHKKICSLFGENIGFPIYRNKVTLN